MTFDSLFPRGDKNDAFAQYFIGQSYLAPLTRRIGLIPTVTTTHPEPFDL